MSTTEVIETSGEPTASSQVAAYVTAVREALADLAPEEVEDLTGGTEADLTELLAERGGSLEQVLGTPRAYAVELRQAAGLPEALVAPATRTIDVGAWWSDRRAALAGLGARYPRLRSLWLFLITLRPAWWLLRGVVAAWVFLVGFGLARLPTYLTFSWALLIFSVPAVLGSVLLGRWSRAHWDRSTISSGSTAPGRGGQRLARVGVGVGNAVVVIAALSGLAAADHDPVSIDSGAGVIGSGGPGLSFEGQSVDNLYVYDAAGHRLSDVRLFGSDGRSIVLDRSTDGTDPSITLPGRADVYGQWWTNVFPRPYTAYGDPYALGPAADPGSPEYGGQTPWRPPPSVAPLAPAPTGPPPSAMTTLPGDVTSGATAPTSNPNAIPTTSPATIPTTSPATIPTTGPSGPSTRPPTPTLPVTVTTGPGGTVTVTGAPTG